MMKKSFSILLLTLFIGTMSFANIFELPDDGKEIQIYPMPIVSLANITSPAVIHHIEVFNLLGTKVAEREGSGAIDFSNLPRGYYLIKVSTPHGEVIKRIQKQ